MMNRITTCSNLRQEQEEMFRSKEKICEGELNLGSLIAVMMRSIVTGAIFAGICTRLQ